MGPRSRFGNPRLGSGGREIFHGAGRASTPRVDLRRSRRNAGKLAPLLLRPGRLWRFLRDREAPWGPKLLMLLSLLYVLVPTDLVPDLVPVVGWLDDAGFVTAALGWLWSSVRRHEARTSDSAAAKRESDPTGGSERTPEAAVRGRRPEAADDPARSAQ